MNTRLDDGRRTRFFGAVIGVIIVTGFVIGQLAQPQSTLVIPRSVGVQQKSQSVQNQVSLHSKKPIVVNVIRSTGEFPLFHPRTLRTDRYGNIYVVDAGDNLVKQFSREGKLLTKFGKGKGSGPGEFLNPRDFTVDADMNIWVCDGKTGLVTVFSKDGSLLRTIRINAVPLRIEVLSANQFVLMLDGQDDLFAFYDSLGRRMIGFGRLIEEQAKYGIVLDGALARVGSHGIVFAPYYSGLLVRFSDKGENEFLVQTIVETPWPRIMLSPDGGSSIDHRNVPLAALALSCWQDTLYILSRVGPQGPKESRIDVYTAQDGKYVHSIVLSQRVRDAIVTGDHIFSLADTTITVWKR